MNHVCRALPLVASILVTILAIGCPIADAQPAGGNISVFADAAGSSCSLVDVVNAPINVYIVHTNLPPSGLTGSRFKMVESPGFQATYVAETIALPNYFGSLMTGIAFVYTCTTQTMLLATVTFNGHGTSTTCSYLDIAGDPAFSDVPIAQNCAFDLYPAPSVGKLLVNPDPILCQPPCAVPTRPSTWGQVKGLYRQ